MALSSNQIAERFSNGKICKFWLTRKQANWILSVWQQETKSNTHFGRVQAKGEFRNENGLFSWTADEGYHGSAIFKVWQYEEKEQVSDPIDHPFYKYIIANGYSWQEVTNNSGLMEKLIIKFMKVQND